MRIAISNGHLKFAWVTLASSLGLMGYLMANEFWAKSFLTGSVIIPALLLIVGARDRIPTRFIAFYTFVTLFNVICMGWDLYNTVFHMDEIAHFFTSMALAPCAGFLLAKELEVGMRKSPHLFYLLALSITFSIGAGWEVLEYLIQVEAYYDDTMTDLIADLLGASLGSLFALNFFLRRLEKEV